MERKIRNSVLKGLLSALVIISCSLDANARKLVILHTNDTHSQIEEIRSGNGIGKGGIHQRAEFFAKIKAENENVLILDAGDYNQGTPYFTIFKGDLEVQVMNELGYEVVTLGNHEFDNGLDELARRLKNARYTTVCANYDFTDTPLRDIVKPYVIIERGGLKIGIFGITTDLKTLVAKQNIKGMVYKDAYQVTDATALKLRNELGCDLVIALTHIGYSGYPDQLSDINLAQKTENVDIIIGGHSHTFLKSEKIYKNRAGKDVVIVQAGAQGEYVGQLEIEY
ncbi:MAG: metallophosphoesterase [Candidatus Coprenecus sp.]|nr:metallophosphoesterase [Candidatus Coprenecus sp.]